MLKIKFQGSNFCTSPVTTPRNGANYRPYSPTTMINAYSEVLEKNSSIRGAARKYCVSEATLRDRISGRVSENVIKSGKNPMLEHLVEHLKVMTMAGYGYSRAEVVDIATNYAISLNKRNEDHPLSLMWFHKFMKRWPELKVQKARSLELQRAKATSEKCVSAYFKDFEKILSVYDLTPERIYNIDEKGLKPNHTPPNIVSGGDCVPPAVVSGKGNTVTMIGCGNALGQSIPPYFVFPGAQMRMELLIGATPGSDGTVSASGWSNSSIFKYNSM